MLNVAMTKISVNRHSYCHPRGDDASVSSREYADEIDRILKNHKKRA